jgi:Na+/phosphate symporter
MKAEEIKALEDKKDKDAINQRLQSKDVRKRERRLLNRALDRLKPKRKSRVKKDKAV